VEWKASLEDLRSKLVNVEGLTGLKDRLSGEWVAIPKTFREGLKNLTAKTETKPDQSATIDAQTFLTTEQLSLTERLVRSPDPLWQGRGIRAIMGQ
jgi:hypothetical protein